MSHVPQQPNNAPRPLGPFARRQAEIRKLMVEIMAPAMPEITRVLLAKAKAGDTAAMKLVLQYGIGIPQDPPRADGAGRGDVGQSLN